MAHRARATRGANRILTTHVGSLIRPPGLVAFLRKVEGREPYDQKAYAQCLRRSVAAVVRAQADAGIDIVSDGEFGKTGSWSRYVMERLTGFEFKVFLPGQKKERGANILSGRDRELFPEFYAEYDKTWGIASYSAGRWVCSGPIAYRGHALLQRDIDNLKAALKTVGVEEGFLPVVAPASVVPERKDEHYGDDEAYIFAVARALREEYSAIVRAGLIVQIDDAHLPYMYERMVPPASLKDYRKWAALRVEALNHALEGIPQERTRYHICWGSWNGPHSADVPLKDIVDLVLRVRVGAYAIEAANPRHEHEWRVWESVRLPPGRKLIPGRHQPRDQRRRASGAGGAAHRAARQDRRAGERHGGDRLRLRARTFRATRPSVDHVGQAARAGGGRADRVEGTLGRKSRKAA